MTSEKTSKVGLVFGLVVALASGIALSPLGCGGSGDDCEVGAEMCKCASGNTCAPGLACLSNTCVKGGPGQGGAPGSMGGAPAGTGGAPAGPDLSSFTGTWKYISGSAM